MKRTGEVSKQSKTNGLAPVPKFDNYIRPTINQERPIEYRHQDFLRNYPGIENNQFERV